MDQKESLLNQLNSLLGHKSVLSYYVENCNSRTTFTIELVSQKKKHRSPAKVRRDSERQLAYQNKKTVGSYEQCETAVYSKAWVAKLEECLEKSAKSIGDYTRRLIISEEGHESASNELARTIVKLDKEEKITEVLRGELKDKDLKLGKCEEKLCQLQEQLDVIKSTFTGVKPKVKKPKKKVFKKGTKVLITDGDTDSYIAEPYEVIGVAFKEECGTYLVKSLYNHKETERFCHVDRMELLSEDNCVNYKHYQDVFSPGTQVYVRDKSGVKKKRKRNQMNPEGFEEIPMLVKNVESVDSSGVTYRIWDMFTSRDSERIVKHEDLFPYFVTIPGED